jgi:hypothetical protein
MDNPSIENHQTSFNSPYPFLIRLRNSIFGIDKPDGYTQATFYLNLIIWTIFFIWSIASYIAISFRHLIFEEKGIPVELIIRSRGTQLGFEDGEFLNRLLTFHSISIVCWIFVFIGIVLLWRKNLNFVYFFFGGTIFYFGMLIFYLNFSYFKDDTTFFDKIIFLALNANALMYYFLLRKESQSGTLSFFGEDEEDE